MWRKQAVFTAVALCAAGSSLAQSCPCSTATAVSDATALAALLGDKTVCAMLGNDAWQEYHTGTTPAGGALVDYKRGPDDAVDPSKTVGSWSVTSGNPSTVNYAYTGGSTYSYSVCQSGTQVTFCGATNVIGTLMQGKVGCGFARTQGAKKPSR